MYAHPEALAQVDAALELWPQVPDAPELCGVRQVDIVQYAAVQSDCRVASIALEFLGTAAALCDVDVDPVTAGLVHERSAATCACSVIPADEILDHVERAVALVPELETAAPRRPRDSRPAADAHEPVRRRGRAV